MIDLDTYYRQRLRSLWLILQDEKLKFISKEYVQEKLQAILKGTFGIHPTIISGAEADSDKKWVSNAEFLDARRELELLEEL